MIKTTKNARNVTKERKKQGRCFIAKLQGHVSILKREDRIMICDKWLHIYGNKLGTGVNCEWVDDVRENVRGYWKKRKDKPLQNWYQCSNCGSICGETPKYCSECGAQMIGDNDV